jgi:1-acyl-sn-glycerol-3-phosphate acyltransferase
MIRQLLKFIVVAFVKIGFILSSLVARFIIPSPMERRRFYLKNVSRFSKVTLKLMNIELEIVNPERFSSGNHLILANHLSYLDGLIMGAVTPVCFVTSIEMRNTFFLGLMTELGGSLYVERRSRDNLSNEIGEITHALRQGFDVMVFPEATSTDGSAMKPFKRSLLKAAVDAEKNILPVCINYLEIDGEPVTSKNRDTLCWYGDMSFAPHFFGLMRPRSVKIRVTALPELPVTKDSSRDVLIEEAYHSISSQYKNIL